MFVSEGLFLFFRYCKNFEGFLATSCSRDISYFSHPCFTSRLNAISVAEWIAWLPRTQKSRVSALLERSNNLCVFHCYFIIPPPLIPFNRFCKVSALLLILMQFLFMKQQFSPIFLVHFCVKEFLISQSLLPTVVENIKFQDLFRCPLIRGSVTPDRIQVYVIPSNKWKSNE